jgi:2-polyprenyl-3-methyl-5-hydroxy-6-metoxy-1,4-benzoquinol methylase
MRFALWPNLTQAVGRRSGAPPLNTTVPAICEPRTHRLPTPAGPDPRPFSATFPAEATLPHHVVSYGPDIPNERAYRLLGNVEGKRVLELGCGGDQASIALAHQGPLIV